MKINQIILGRWLFFCLICSAVINSSQAGVQPSVTVKSYAKHMGNNTVYTYSVTNNGPNRLFSFNIGCHCLNADDPQLPDAGPQLIFYPADYDFKNDATSKSSYSAPTGWDGLVAHYEGNSYISFEFSAWDSGIPLLPGYTGTFSIITPTRNDPHFVLYTEHPKGTAYFFDKNRQGYLTGYYSYLDDDATGKTRTLSYPMQLIDLAPPTISVTLSPATLWPPNNKAVPIAATITVNDNYDPEPEIKLESITANETLDGNDIQDAQLGTDDRSFLLTAKRAGNNMAGRTYTITYSATDASGNKATASATITVPHDQGM